jgi:hypothetical protein
VSDDRPIHIHVHVDGLGAVEAMVRSVMAPIEKSVRLIAEQGARIMTQADDILAKAGAIIDQNAATAASLTKIQADIATLQANGNGATPAQLDAISARLDEALAGVTSTASTAAAIDDSVPDAPPV